MNYAAPALLALGPLVFLTPFLLACTDPTPPATAASPTPPWVPASQHGNHEVGVRTEVIEAARGDLTVEIWYPSEPSATDARYDLPYTPPSIAHRDATPAGMGHPAIVFSHGHGGGRHQSVFLMERLASHGFVVVGVDHPHNTLFDFDEDVVAQVAGRRPDDVRQVIDALDELVPDAPALGMLGHSFGAWTSLVMGGGQIDLEAGRAYCDSHDPAGCGIVGDIDGSAGSFAPDGRIDATMVLAPGGAYSFADLSAVSPVLVLSGDLDGDLPYEEEQVPVWESLGVERSRLVLHGGGHFGFTDACALVPLADCAGAADGYMEPLRMQELTVTIVMSWAGVHLLGDERYAEELTGTSDSTWQ